MTQEKTDSGLVQDNLGKGSNLSVNKLIKQLVRVSASSK